MAGSLNKASIIGNVGKDPDIRALQNGSKIANFSVATSESWKDKATGEKKERTEWHRVVVFNEHLVKVIEQYVKKGAKIYLEGQLQTRKWTDKDGVERYSTEIVLAAFNGTIVLLGSPQGSGSAGGESGGTRAASPQDRQAPQSGYNRNEMDDEIPF